MKENCFDERSDNTNNAWNVRLSDGNVNNNNKTNTNSNNGVRCVSRDLRKKQEEEEERKEGKKKKEKKVRGLCPLTTSSNQKAYFQYLHSFQLKKNIFCEK